MMYIGTNLGSCIASLLRGEVRLDDVNVILCRTGAQTYEEFIAVVQKCHEAVVRKCHEHGNVFASKLWLRLLRHFASDTGYEFAEFPWEQVRDLAHELWYTGRIHQPRNFGDYNTLWVEVGPLCIPSDPKAGKQFRVTRNWREQSRVLAALAE